MKTMIDKIRKVEKDLSYPKLPLDRLSTLDEQEDYYNWLIEGYAHQGCEKARIETNDF